MSTRKIRTRDERKMAARLMISMARRHGVWTDGQHIYRGDDLKALLKSAVDRLANDVTEKLPPHNKMSNSVQLLGMIAKRPDIHKLPKNIPEMLAFRAARLHQDAIMNVPGAMDHFLLTRRLAKRVGSVLPGQLRLPMEIAKIAGEIDKAKTLLTTEEIMLESGEVCPAGTILKRDPDDALVTPDGDLIWTSGKNLVDRVKIVNICKNELKISENKYEFKDI